MILARAPIACGLFAIALLGWFQTISADAILRIANPGKPASIDPHKITGVWENRIVGDMFMGLTTEGADGSVIPGAAESWRVSNGGRTYQFQIREHSWSDGRPVPAPDFVFSLRRMLDPNTACAYADFFFLIEGARAFAAGDATAESVAIEALGPRELRIRLERPVAYFPGLLMHFAAMPVPRHAIALHGSDWTDPDKLVVNGAFMMSARIPNDYVELRRNPRFFAAAEVLLDGVRYYSQENRDAAVQRFRAGQVDVVRDFPSGKARWLREISPAAVRTGPYLGITYVAVNHRREALADLRVREALSLGLERNLITGKVLGSGETPAFSLVPPGTGHYGESARFAYADWPSERRLARAQQLMTDAGYGPSRRLALQFRLRTSENDRRVALAAQSMWKALFVDVELQRAETAIHYSRLQQGDFDLALASWLAVYDDPQTFTLLLESARVNNLGAYRNPRYDALTAAAATSLDIRARAAGLRKAETLALTDHGLIPVFHHAARNLVAPTVSGWVENRLDVHRSRYLGLRP